LHRDTSKLTTSDEENIMQNNNDTKYEDIIYEMEFNPTDVEPQKSINYRDEGITAIIRKYVCCAEVWKGVFLMFFYQFAGYNVVSFYATSILNHPKETEQELIHPNKTNDFVYNLDELTVKKT
jgi:hypothetical protein